MLQTRDQPNYSGSEFLFAIEDCLKNYNRWIVESILRGVVIDDPKARVMDFGSGAGTLSVIFDSLTGIRPEGVELDAGLSDVMRSRGFVTFHSLSSVAGTFDLIFSSNVLEHIPDDTNVMRELRGKLKPTGMLVIYVPAFRLLWSSMDDAVGHYRRYTKSDLALKLKGSGFIVTDLRYCDSAGFLVTLLFKMIGRNQGKPSAKALSLFDLYILPFSKLLDRFTHSFLGKNVIAFAKPDPGR